MRLRAIFEGLVNPPPHAPCVLSPLVEVLSGQSAVAAAMLSPVVQAALQMGFQRALVESLVQSRYLLTGRQYLSVSDLVADVLLAEEEERQGSESRPGVQRHLLFYTSINQANRFIKLAPLEVPPAWALEGGAESKRHMQVHSGTPPRLTCEWFVPSRACGEAGR